MPGRKQEAGVEVFGLELSITRGVAVFEATRQNVVESVHDVMWLSMMIHTFDVLSL